MSRELDAAIAEALGKTVEWELICHNLAGQGYTFSDGPFINPDPGGVHQEICPRYSTDGNAMLELDKEMWKRGWVTTIARREDCCVCNYYKPFGELYDGNKMYIAKADINAEPLARALAAYKALTGKEWQEGVGE